MAIIQSDAAKGKLNVPYPGYAGQAVKVRYSMPVPTTVDDGDILELAPIPPNCRVVDIVLDTDDLDSHGTPAMSIDVGIMSGEWGNPAQDRTCGDEFIAASTTPRTGGVVRPSTAGAYRTGKSDKARSIGVKIVAKAATAAAGSVGLTVTVTS